MSANDAERFIAENTNDRRDDPFPHTEFAVLNPETGETEGVSNFRTAQEIAARRGHKVVDRSTGRVYPGANPIRPRGGNPYGLSR